jgi:Rieske Fe-S protein
VYIATGDSGNGMTHGTIAGILITDLIMGRENPWAAVYDPSRITLRAAGAFTRENLNFMAHYNDLVTSREIGVPEQLDSGEGAILRRGLKKFAVFRDDAGALHELSAHCPHLGCIVQWNRSEKTWDYPCHGSRFNSRGDVVNGPAISGLSRPG